MNFCVILSAIFIFLKTVESASLEVVTDDELLNLFKSEKYVVVLFTKKDCEQCDNYENELIHLREDLVDTLNAWVVKAVNSQLVRLYNPNKEPALVFFRHGIPLLYDGPINDDMILHTFTENKEPAVKELSDDNFEHLTQAASGATTGDWFIMFYSTDCVECQRLQARFEAVGAKLRTRMNVARVNKHTTGAVTARRFGVWEVPSFILFRQGNMYRYTIHKYDVVSFVSFVTDWYKNARKEKVPVPKNEVDDFLQMVVDYLRDNPWIWKIGFGSVGFTILSIFIIISKLKAKKPPLSALDLCSKVAKENGFEEKIIHKKIDKCKKQKLRNESTLWIEKPIERRYKKFTYHPWAHNKFQKNFGKFYIKLALKNDYSLKKLMKTNTNEKIEDNKKSGI
ncbi:hypothetical protein L9F63_020533 [Diploptera punctata]|uniref:Thioredoxin domain-containing protein n=1 Tax=Diploptera punctata TaxID=6984 RepID=A0AAD7ZSE2_DIPPU|nr:hypothetical protein L9F63_020533 [Diploptera punctata]